MKDVIILGAGITGLTTAYHLKKRGLDFMLLEQEARVGGVIHSVREMGFLYEEGPNSGVIGNPEVIRLFEELSPDCELEIANEKVKKRYVLKNGKWEPLPGGMKAAVTTPLFAFKDKLRILLEPFRPAGKDPHETLAGLVKRRMGKSFLDYAVDPFIIGVYAGDPDRLVPKYALPKLYNLEQQYGSFVGGTIKKQFVRKSSEEKKVSREVFSVKGGISSLIAALETKIGKQHIVLNCRKATIQPVNGHFQVSFVNENGESVTKETRSVVSTIGAHGLGRAMPFIADGPLSRIMALHYTKVIQVVVGFREWKGMDPDAFGGLIPFVENRDLLGVLFMSSLFEDRAPEGGALFSIFMGGVRRPDIIELTDNEVKALLEKEFCDLMKLDDFKPDLLKIIRHSYAIPQYEADSGERFAVVRDLEKQYPGLILGGNLRDGIGMADRIRQAKCLADAIG